jgi:hypothetical protein
VVSVKRIDEKTIEQTDKRNGKVVESPGLWFPLTERR